MSNMRLWTDGSTTGYGLILKDSADRTVCLKASVLPPGALDHSDAEYLAVIAGLKEARGLGATAVHVQSDSDFMINQLNGKFKVGERMRSYFDKVRDVQAEMQVTFEWIPREKNLAADELSKHLR